MQTSWSDNFLELSEIVFGFPYASNPFWIVVSFSLGALLLFGWLIANFIFSAKRGLVVCFLAQLMPAVVAAIGWIAVTIYAVPEMEPGTIRNILPWIGAFLGGFLGTLLLTRFFLGISEGKTFFSIIFTYAIVFGVIYLGGTLVREMDTGLGTLQEKRDDRERDTESIYIY